MIKNKNINNKKNFFVLALYCDFCPIRPCHLKKTNKTEKSTHTIRSRAHTPARSKHTKTSKQKQEMSLKKTNGVGLKKEENITQARLSTCT